MNYSDTYMQVVVYLISHSKRDPNIPILSFILQNYRPSVVSVLENGNGLLNYHLLGLEILPPNICIFPDAGAVYSTRGFVDFHIGIGGGWVVEFLRDGNKREDHMKRFMRNDKYYPIVLEVAEWVVIDVRGPLCSVADVIVDNLMVVNINADYTSASIRFGKEDLGNILFLG
ncbi:hypothetical protein BC833DRAFT_625257 [Globomyces pollinis-pini]|nr:hypothetical protein BC833DRAFT_625257 [Globomyces pollinis-pini]